MGWKGESRRHSLARRGIRTADGVRLSERKRRRNPAFMIEPEVYRDRRRRAEPLAQSTAYNVNKLIKANIWYTKKTDPRGRYMVHILPEDFDRVHVSERLDNEGNYEDMIVIRKEVDPCRECGR